MDSSLHSPVENTTLTEVANIRWDAIVVGAGPAGAIAAYQLAKSGRQTLLVDRKRFPRPKVCGACLNQRAIRTLHNLGIHHLDRLDHLATRRFEMMSCQRRLSIHVPEGIAVSRSTMDVALIEAAIQAGACFLSSTEGSTDPLAAEHDDLRTIELKRDQTSHRIASRSILCADGLTNSSLRRIVGFDSNSSEHSHVGLGGAIAISPEFAKPGTIYMAIDQQGYVGMVRLADGSLNVAAAMNPAFLKSHGSAANAVAYLARTAGYDEITSQLLEPTRWLGTIPLTRRAPQIHEHRLLLVGDAAGYIEPFTGEGMAWAIAGGAAAGKIAHQFLDDWSPDAERKWQVAYRQIVGRRQFWCRAISQTLRYPWLVQGLLATLKVAPVIPQQIARSINNVRT